MDWEDAMEAAREYHCISEGQYVDKYDWEELVETAKWLLREAKERKKDEMREDHKEYLNSERWKKLRLEILERDLFKCKDCGTPATEVHHCDYQYLHCNLEKDYCHSLCRKCHQRRHDTEDMFGEFVAKKGQRPKSIHKVIVKKDDPELHNLIKNQDKQSIN